MVMKTASKSFSVALFSLIVVLVVYISLFSYASDLLLIRSLRFSQGTLQQSWKSKRIERNPQEMTTTTITCDRSNSNYDLCSLNGSCILDLRTRTITLVDSKFATSATLVEKIRPYPKKVDTWVMSRIDELVLTSGPRSCDVTHDSPAIVFSGGGYTGSIYHDFFDVFIPLFITTNKYFPDRDFILVVANPKNWWMPKYNNILGEFSKHKTILLDKENVTITHCFTSAIVGLISHESMTVDSNQTTNSKSLVDFHNFLGKAFNTNTTIKRHNKPRLILVTRNGDIGRVMLNEKEIKEMLEDVGFEVITFRPTGATSLREAYELIKSSHGMIGVHGAALTHLLFLRPGSVFVQVVPIGLQWAKSCYESPAKAMKLDSIEYPINVEESSLVEKYDRDNLVLKDPKVFRGLDWNVSKMKVYLKEQDVRLDVNRFRKHMLKAYHKAKKIMDING